MNVIHSLYNLPDKVTPMMLNANSEIVTNISHRLKDETYKDMLYRSISSTHKASIILSFMSIIMIYALFTIVPETVSTSINRKDYTTIFALAFGVLFTFFALFPMTVNYIRLNLRFRKLRTNALTESINTLTQFGQVRPAKIVGLNRNGGEVEIIYESIYKFSGKNTVFKAKYNTELQFNIEIGQYIKVLSYNEFLNVPL